MNKQKWTSGLVIGIVALGAWFFNDHANQKKKIEALTQESTLLRNEMVKDYDERLRLVVEWQKALNPKVRAAKTANLDEIVTTHQKLSPQISEQGALDRFEMNQNHLNQIISELLVSKEAQATRPKSLETSEERINRIRRQYVELAFKTDDLIQKTHSNVARVPVFQAEDYMRKQGLWK